MLNYKTLSNPTNYNNLLFRHLAQVEGVEKHVYKDSAGLYTIGVGYNLQSSQILDEVIFDFGFDSTVASHQVYIAQFHALLGSPPATTAQLQADLDNIMIASASTVGHGRTSFSYANDADAARVFPSTASGFEQIVCDWGQVQICAFT